MGVQRATQLHEKMDLSRVLKGKWGGGIQDGHCRQENTMSKDLKVQEGEHRRVLEHSKGDRAQGAVGPGVARAVVEDLTPDTSPPLSW